MSMAQKRERILPRLIEEEMRESFLDYSMSVIVQRALPDVRDGLKPVHRRILYAMHGLGLVPDRAHKKSASVVGEVLGKYHPHGDTAVYDALVRMVQDFSLRYPLVDGQGNFGSIDGDSAAAYRYTEAKLASVSLEMLEDIAKDTVNFVPNFDDRLEEPSVLPARLPNLLVNGSSGIAVGMSTNIPPHNLKEVAGALTLLVQNPDVTVEELMKTIPGPDFPTGGFVVGMDGVRDMYATGRGRIVMRARVVRESLRGGREQLVVTELPYAVSKGKLIDQILGLSRKGQVDELSDIRDESDRDGMRLVMELKRGSDPGKVMEVLFRRTHLQSTFGAILLALDHGEPKELNLKEMLERFRDHRLEVIQRRSRFDLEKAEAERHVVQGLMAALDHIDEVIAIIRASQNREEASERLQDRFGLSVIQADAILNMRLGRLTALERLELEERLSRLEAAISELRDILGSHERQLQVILDETREVVEKFGDARRTVLLDGEEEEFTPEKMVADEDVVITVTRQGFVKRMPVHLYRRRVSKGMTLAGMDRFEDDFLEQVFTARSSAWLLAFTQGGKAYFLPVMDTPESDRSSRGQSLYGLLDADRSDPVVSLLPVEDLQADRTLLFLTRGGVVKRSQLPDFSNPRSGGIIAAGVKDGDALIRVTLTDGSSDVMLISREGRAIRFPETDIPVLGRTAQGVKGMGLKGEDQVVGMLLLRREAAVLTVTADGMGKRSEVGEFPVQKRGGLGNLVSPGGAEMPVVGALEVLERDEVTLLTADGQALRVAASKAPVQGRRTRGGRLVKLNGGDRVVEVVRSPGTSEDPEEEGGEIPTPDGGNPPPDGGSPPPDGSDPPPDEGHQTPGEGGPGRHESGESEPSQLDLLG
ncbi:MAG: DNA gyrase subunit A [Gemmatimonadota bacterium]